MSPPQKGMTLLEMMIATAIGVILMVTALSIGTETIAFASFSEDEAVVQNECHRAIDRLTEILRKSGWNTASSVEYPNVAAGGAQLNFRILYDRDGNGYPFNQTTGDLEWYGTVYTVRLDPATRVLAIYDGTTPVWTLGRCITSVSFSTFRQDPTLHYKEIHVQLTANRVSTRGISVDYQTTASIHMRN